MITCDICGENKPCAQKEIEGKVYDFCSDCWNALAEKLKGKGREKHQRDHVFLPIPPDQPEPAQPTTPPATPPIIWSADALH